jgi:hypothetical protein
MAPKRWPIYQIIRNHILYERNLHREGREYFIRNNIFKVFMSVKIKTMVFVIIISCSLVGA